jgi:hypothetical protein
MKSQFRSLAILIMCLAALGCRPAEEPGKLSPEEAAEARRTIVAWLECEECTDGELEAVVTLGKVAVPSLVASLQKGPAPASLELVRRQLAANYKAIVEYARTHPEAKIPMSEETYVKTYLDNYIALYRIRSAESLAEIGGPEAKRALEEALAANYRDDVRTVVKESLEKLGG